MQMTSTNSIKTTRYAFTVDMAAFRGKLRLLSSASGYVSCLSWLCPSFIHSLCVVNCTKDNQMTAFSTSVNFSVTEDWKGC